MHTDCEKPGTNSVTTMKKVRSGYSRVLLVEANESLLFTLKKTLESEGLDVAGYGTAADALYAIQQEDFGVAVVDLRLPDIQSTPLLKEISDLESHVQVIINADHDNIESAKDALKHGAFAYVEKARPLPILVREVHRAIRSHCECYIEKLETDVAERTFESSESETRLRLVFEKSPACLFHEDFSEVKRHFDRLRQQGVDDFREYFENNPEAVAKCAKLVKILDVNLAALQFHHAANKQELMASLERGFCEESYPVFCEELIAIANGAISFESDAVVHTLDGIKKNIVLRMFIDPNSPHWSNAYVALIDVTERVQAEVKLRESEEHYRRLVELMPIAVYTCDTEGRITSFNDQAATCWGIRPKINDPDTLFCGSFRLYRPDGSFLPRHKTPMSTALCEGRAFHYQELMIERRDGSRITVLANIDPTYDPSGTMTGAVNVFTDITERKRAEEEKAKLQEDLRHSHKMQAVGQLAAGVAHEFNNILAGIRGNAELLLRTSGDFLSERSRRPLKDIERSGVRAFELTQQLLSFARPRKQSIRVFDINPVVSNSKSMLVRLIGANIKLKTRLSTDPVLVSADEGELEQAIVNLVGNARDAMPNGGTITIETRIVTLEKRDVPRNCEAGQYVQLSVVDDGCGMSPETVGRIFEPFFTTKPVGKGTGLGLSTVYADIEKYGGFLSVESRTGTGTVICVHLPRSQELGVEARAVEDHSSNDFVGGDETILVCDDEEVVRSSACALLESVGYTVIGVGSGQEALEVAAAHAGQISLLLTDVTMPEMDGFELGKEMNRRYPDMKIIYSSGYASDRIELRATSRRHAFLCKGGPSTTIFQRIREVLDNNGQPCDSVS